MSRYILFLLSAFLLFFTSCKKKYKCVCVNKGFRVYEEDYTMYDEKDAKLYCEMLNEHYEEQLQFGQCKLKYTNL